VTTLALALPNPRTSRRAAKPTVFNVNLKAL
jgi:hypothetical protein